MLVGKNPGSGYLSSEDSERIKFLHGLGFFWYDPMEKTNHGDILAPIERISNKHHPLPSEHFPHESGIEAANCHKFNHN